MPRTATFDTGKLLELEAKGLTQAEIAAVVGVSRDTVAGHLARFSTFTNLRDGIEEFRQFRADLFAGLQAKLLAAIANKLDDEKELAKLSPYAMTGMIGLIYDKERLETGKSSSNVAILSGIINKSEQSGDSALRKLTVEPVKVKPIE
jgi:transcriptional regulator with XRE-family HTH domain